MEGEKTHELMRVPSEVAGTDAEIQAQSLHVTWWRSDADVGCA